MYVRLIEIPRRNCKTIFQELKVAMFRTTNLVDKDDVFIMVMF